MIFTSAERRDPMNTILILFLVGQSPSNGLDLVDVYEVSHVEVILDSLSLRAARSMSAERLEKNPPIKAEFRGARL